MKILCSICAREGSKGVVNKNVREFLGRPLIAYTIEQAKATGLFECISVSSDSDKILEVGKEFGANYTVKRSSELSSDKAAKVPVIRNCLVETEINTGVAFDYIIDLDCTSPLRNLDDIKNCVEMIQKDEISNVITAAPSRRSPYFNLIEFSKDGKIAPAKKLESNIVRRQDAPRCFDMNASIYAWKKKVLMENDIIFLENTALYEMPEERSIDIDSELDFLIVETLAKKRLEDGYIR